VDHFKKSPHPIVKKRKTTRWIMARDRGLNETVISVSQAPANTIIIRMTTKEMPAIAFIIRFRDYG
jgi:hypothetical protein